MRCGPQLRAPDATDDRSGTVTLRGATTVDGSEKLSMKTREMRPSQMPKKEINVGVEALRISEEQGITFKEAWVIALEAKRAGNRA